MYTGGMQMTSDIPKLCVICMHSHTNSVFVDAGAGMKIPFTDNIALKLEALYILKENDTRNDNNLLILAVKVYNKLS